MLGFAGRLRILGKLECTRPRRSCRRHTPLVVSGSLRGRTLRSHPSCSKDGHGIKTSLPPWLDLLELRATELRNDRSYGFLPDGGARSAGSRSTRLPRECVAGGGPNPKLHAAWGFARCSCIRLGLSFVVGYLGCLYAGVMAVPAYPPQAGRSLQRVFSIVRDARASVAVDHPRAP